MASRVLASPGTATDRSLDGVPGSSSRTTVSSRTGIEALLSAEGIQAAEALVESHPGTAVVVLSQYADPTYLLRLVTHGSARRGYMLKDNVATPGELGRAIALVGEGGSFIDPAVVETLVAQQPGAGRSAISALTTREQSVLAELASGKSNAAIAVKLSVGERAVEKHINSIFAKLGLHDAPDVNRRVLAVLTYLGR